MTKRKFYKQQFSMLVLSEEPINPEMSLAEIVREAIEGGFSASDDRGPCLSINGRRAARLLEEQGSAPEFFQLDAEGNDLE